MHLAVLAAAVLALAACAAGVEQSGHDELTVFAASSLEPVLTDWRPEIEARIGVDVQFSFAASSVLARQVAEGAPADVLITADRTSMQVAAQAGAVGDRAIVARNRLTIVVPSSNPRRLNSLRDLAQRDLRLVLCDPDVPCGRLTARLLSEAGVTVEPVSLEESASAAVGKVVFGQADATVAYNSDVQSRPGKIDGIDVPEVHDRDLEAVYPAAVLTEAEDRAEAHKFIRLLVSEEGAERLKRAGFLGAGGP